MSFKFLQINLNKSRLAQDNCFQTCKKWDIDVVIVSEPNFIPTNWYKDKDAKAAICLCKLEISSGLIIQEEGFVAVRINRIIVVSCYFNPNDNIGKYKQQLQKLSDLITLNKNEQILIVGDFNANLTLWGSNRNNTRGFALLDVMSVLDVRLINIGNIPTCVRSQGTSVVDLTWATTSLLPYINGWRVMDNVDDDSLSDHRYIRFDVCDADNRILTKHSNPKNKNKIWNMNKFNKDIFVVLMEGIVWTNNNNRNNNRSYNINREVNRVTRIITKACDAAAPLVKKKNNRNVYWWNNEVSEKRKSYIKLKRSLLRKNKRKTKNTEEDAILLKRQCKLARVALQKEISLAKIEAWKELVNDLDRDPWGRAYRLVINKLKPRVPPVVSSFTYKQIKVIIKDLFPRDRNDNNAKIGDRCSDNCTQNINREENYQHPFEDIDLAEVKKSMISKNKKVKTAPGPDGITKKIWMYVPDCFLQRLVKLYNECLRKGIFPDKWKISRLVLLPKSDKITPDARYRPICLLNEVGKFLERILAERMKKFMKDNLHASLANNQYGFREGFSTLDPLIEARNFIKNTFNRKEYVVAVSLDINNAFNSLPWKIIKQNMKRKKFPEYLIKIIDSYLNNRKISFIDNKGISRQQQVFAGVPQGSVLGPVLWNVAYDWVLKATILESCCTLCYADDTLVLAAGSSPISVKRRMNVVIAMVTNRIQKLGLTVATNKTKAVIFYGGRRFPEEVRINVLNDVITTDRSFKYLGVTYDTKLTFKPHLKPVEVKISGIMRLLWRILPNLKGPNSIRQRLYANIVHSVILYASPVWGANFVQFKTYQTSIIRIQRSIALKVISAYRTVSYRAATLLAKTTPIFLMVAKNIRIYERVKEATNNPDSLVTVLEIIAFAEVLMKRQWKLWLSGDAGPGVRVTKIILPFFEDWLKQEHCVLDYYITQMITGHGSFSEYLYKIKKINSPTCIYCEEEIDTTEHTFSRCPAWTYIRFCFEIDLQDEVEWKNIILKAIHDREVWTKTRTYCRKILTIKESDERRR